MTVRHIFEISEDDHPRLVTHARDIWWTLDSANAFVSPGVNSRGELVPSHGASRRRLGDKQFTNLRLTHTTQCNNDDSEYYHYNIGKVLHITMHFDSPKCIIICKILLVL
jgi:hypothetical protein